MPGYEIDRFVDLTQNEKNELICSICQDILRCPVVTSCCLQSFCEECIKDWLNNNNTCPFDRNRLTTNQLSRAPRMVMNLLGKLRIRCDFRDYGCDKVIFLENLNNHLEQCQYNTDIKECQKCFCSNIKANHDCIEYLLDTNNKIANELNQLKLSNEEMKKEKENLLRTIADLKYEVQCSSENFVEILDTVLTLIGKTTNNQNTASFILLSELMYLMVTNDKFKSITNEEINRSVITKILDLLHMKCNETQVTANLLRTLAIFKIPEDVEFEYNRVVDSVIHIIDREKFDKTILETCFYVLYFLTFVKSKRQVIGSEKGIKTILKRLREKVAQNSDKVIVSCAWSILWNITDENAVVCETFYKHNGLECFIACYASFPTNLELIRAMFRVLANVAECPHLRKNLLDTAYMDIFMRHLERRMNEHMEHCIIAGGIVSNLLLVNEEMWNRKLPDNIRADVQRVLNAAIQGWDIETERSLNYNSFKPLEKILISKESPNESKLWVLWEIANLTHVNAAQYCPYLYDCNLLAMVDSISRSTDCPNNMRSLALTVIQHYDNYAKLMKINK